jgi:N,N-dimethylformamidase
VFLNEHREYGHSLYDVHSDGSGVYYTSRLRPILNMQPFIESNHGARPSNLWQFNADTHITDWLEANGFEYDVATDEDLHNEGPDLLRPYLAVMTATHPEYYSERMWSALYGFTQARGRLIYMGGNGFYWRVAFHESEPGIMEVRRAEGGSRAWEPPTGEYYHSFTGEYGGMWRRQGRRAPNVICGVGFIAQGFDESTYYVRQPGSFDSRARFIFEGIGADERIGDFGLIGGGASGMELDSYNPELGSPRHALVLATSATHTEAHVLVVEEMLFNFMGTTGNLCPKVRSDLVFYETVGGGAVFSVGSIAWSGALSHNNYENNVSKIVGNVVRRFLDETPFALSSATAEARG